MSMGQRAEGIAHGAERKKIGFRFQVSGVRKEKTVLKSEKAARNEHGAERAEGR
jgi:hypothetical protein